MERRGTATAAIELADLAMLYDHPGPFATVLVPTPGDMPQATDHNVVAWRPVRERLDQQRIESALLDRLESEIADAHRDGPGLAAVTTLDRVLLIESLPEPPPTPMAHVASLPSLAPVLAARQAQPPTVVALVDREGADMWVLGAPGPSRDDPATAGGGSDPLHKAASGGWSQTRNQRRAEQVWRRNAGDVAEALTELANDVHAAVVAVGGDVRAVQLLEQDVGDALGDRLVRLSETRAADGPHGDLDIEVERARATAAARATVAVLNTFAEERGQLDRGVEGAHDTLAELAAGRVDVLLVHDDLSRSDVAWFGRDGNQVGVTPEEVEAMGARNVNQGRLPDVALRAAAATGAGVRIVPAHGSVVDGVGALLRW